MADYKFGEGIRKFFLAGVGAVAITAEKGQEIITELVKKGELTVEQGKDLNKDLQRSFKESMDKRGVNIDELTQKISKMSADELAKIKEQLAAAEKIVSEKLDKAQEKAEEAAGDLGEAAEKIKEAAADVAEDVKEAAQTAVEDVKEAAAGAPAEEAAVEETSVEEAPAKEEKPEE